jgi:hypothetical protein
MPLAQLSAEERAFLSDTALVGVAFVGGLAARFAAVLSARLRQCVCVEPLDYFAATRLTSTSAEVQNGNVNLDWDDALDVLWLCGRLGGNAGIARSPVLRARLRRTLQLVLAEVWLSHALSAPPAALALLIQTDTRRARLDIVFPDTLAALDHWAHLTIAHAE